MKYDKKSAIARIVRNGGNVAETTKIVECRSPGLKVLGAIDYLVKKHKFYWRKS